MVKKARQSPFMGIYWKQSSKGIDNFIAEITISGKKRLSLKEF